MTGKARAHASIALTCTGYGLFTVAYIGGAVGTTHLWALTNTTAIVVASQLLYLLATAAGSVWLRRVGPELGSAGNMLLCRASYVGCIALPALGYLLYELGAPLWTPCIVWFGLGLASSIPLFWWLDLFVGIYRANSRRHSLAALAGSKVVSALIGALVWVFASKATTLALLIAAIGGSWAIYETLRSRLSAGEKVPPSGMAKARRTYRMTRYGATVLVCFAVTWGLSAGVLMANRPSPTVQIPIWLVGIAVAAALTALFSKSETTSMQFGRLVRYSVAFAAVAWGATPVLGATVPAAIPPLLEAVLMAQGIAMTIFSVEMCRETGMDTVRTITLNYALFAVAGAGAMLAGLTTSFALDNPLSYGVLAFAATLAIAAVIPSLPSSQSGAVAYTWGFAPGEGTSEQTLAAGACAIAARFGLSARESEVMALVVRGSKAQAIADKLGLSVWTVKDHIKSVYEKCGVHSALELSALVANSLR